MLGIAWAAVALSQTAGPRNGYLVIHGGGVAPEPREEFIRLAGGPLLGIGIDQPSGIVVHGDEFRVIGDGYVAIYDARLINANGRFYFLGPGERFRLSTRTPLSSKGTPLWMPNILPAARLTRPQLEEMAARISKASTASRSVLQEIACWRHSARATNGS